jgi:uncharacterized protein YecT (DUF1311 family)
MKTFFLILFVLLVSLSTLGQNDFSGIEQNDVLKIYLLHIFPCDSSTTTLDINRCSGIRRDFADSLLNDYYHKILISLDNDISEWDSIPAPGQSGPDTSAEHKEDQKQIKGMGMHYTRLKVSLIKSQQEWLKLKELDLDMASIQCEGGTGCTAEENYSLITDILDRIKKLQTLFPLYPY